MQNNQQNMQQQQQRYQQMMQQHQLQQQQAMMQQRGYQQVPPGYPQQYQMQQQQQPQAQQQQPQYLHQQQHMQHMNAQQPIQPQQVIQQQPMANHGQMIPGVAHGNQEMMMNAGDSDGMYGVPGQHPRTYRKKKAWPLYLNITIETPDLDNKLNESFQIEIGSNQRLKILQYVILSQVKNPKLRELIQKEQMYIYIEGKEPVARKSKSLAEMGVQDGDNLIVTTEMKLPVTVYSSDDTNNDGQQLFPGFDGQDAEAVRAMATANTHTPTHAQPNMATQQQQLLLQQQARAQGQQPQRNMQSSQMAGGLPQQQMRNPPAPGQYPQATQNQQQQMTAAQAQYAQQQRQGMPQQNRPDMYGQGANHGQQQPNMQAMQSGNHVLTQQQQKQMLQQRAANQQYGAMQGQPNAQGSSNQNAAQRMQSGHPMAQQVAMQGINQQLIRGQPMTETQKQQLLKQQQEALLHQQQKISQMQGKRTLQPAPNQIRPKIDPRQQRKDVKSPSLRRPKEIQYVRLRLVQQYFQGIELRRDEKDDAPAAELPNQPLYTAAENADADKPEESQPADNADNDAEEKGKEAEGEAEEQRASQKVAHDETAVDDRGEEAHEEYEQSQADEAEAGNALYDPSEIMVLEINSRSKARCLQRVILEKSNMKKANVLLFRQVFVKDPNAAPQKPPQPTPQQVQQLAAQGMTQAQIQAHFASQHLMTPQQQQANTGQVQWVQFSKADFDKTVREFEGALIAFKIYLDVRVEVEGRGHTFQQLLQVDPKDEFERTMRTRTLMWTTFMTRGQNKCIIMAQYKGSEEDAYIAPDSFEKSYEELGIHSGCQITLIEFRKKLEDDSSDEEGGEGEMEEGEYEEVEEVEEGDEDAAAAGGEGSKADDEKERPEDDAAEKQPDGDAEKDSGEAKEGGESKPVQADEQQPAASNAEEDALGFGMSAAQQLDMQ